MTLRVAIVLMLLSSPALADDFWLEAAASNSIVNGQRFGISRTLGNFGMDGVSVGLSHARYADAWWTLAEAGMNRRIGERFNLQGKIFAGPGEFGDRGISYRKIVLGGSMALSREWFAQLSDTYFDIDDSRGHLLDAGLTRATAGGLTVTVNALLSAGSAIETRQLGLKANLQREFSYLGGISAGETRNPVLLNEFGGVFDTRVVRIRQAYAGIGIPLGEYTVLAVFDYLRLDDVARRELSIVVRIPIGAPSGGAR